MLLFQEQSSVCFVQPVQGKQNVCADLGCVDAEPVREAGSGFKIAFPERTGTSYMLNILSTHLNVSRMQM